MTAQLLASVLIVLVYLLVNRQVCERKRLRDAERMDLRREK